MFQRPYAYAQVNKHDKNAFVPEVMQKFDANSTKREIKILRMGRYYFLPIPDKPIYGIDIKPILKLIRLRKPIKPILHNISIKLFYFGPPPVPDLGGGDTGPMPRVLILEGRKF
jgi:hypothetical protein